MDVHMKMTPCILNLFLENMSVFVLRFFVVDSYY